METTNGTTWLKSAFGILLALLAGFFFVAAILPQIMRFDQEMDIEYDVMIMGLVICVVAVIAGAFLTRWLIAAFGMSLAFAGGSAMQVSADTGSIAAVVAGFVIYMLGVFISACQVKKIWLAILEYTYNRMAQKRG